eukprot:TRINITY_DN1279_c0_g1_i1.p1 TRINITY_DN1279_c0_g1~~TRINITY_DN1279_c0_g1_i1.p1  ORF type:complete len:1017 (-),score=326.77 TRINITY_DN1279_c0_g1_i1:166-3216(-)
MEFTLKPEELHLVSKKRDHDELAKLGGVSGVVGLLHSDGKHGIKAAEAAQRRAFYGENRNPAPPMVPFWKMLLEALSDTTLIILMVAAVISLILGTAVKGSSSEAYPKCGLESVKQSHESNVEWIEGVAILISVAVVSLVTSGNDYSKQMKFRALSEEEKNVQVKVIRDGENMNLSIYELVVGDVVALDTGDQIPADGYYINGFDLRCDESQMTGESDAVKKSHEHPFMLAGCKVTDGNGTMICTGVGPNSEWGTIMASLGETSKETPLQEALDQMAQNIGKFGMTVAFIIFAALMISWIATALGDSDVYNLTDGCVQGEYDPRLPGKEYADYDWKQAKCVVDYFIIAITIIVVAVPEGLPLAVTISLAYSMRQMFREKNLVRHLKACETMSNCTNICSDKTGTLTENRMTVVKGWVAKKTFDGKPSKESFNENLLTLLSDGIVCNCAATSNVDYDAAGKKYNVVGNKTECALIIFLVELGIDYKALREKMSDKIAQRFPFSSKVKRMTTLFSLGENKIRVYSKGAPEMLLEACSHYLGPDGVEPLTPSVKKAILKYIFNAASSGNRTIGLAYKDIDAPEKSHSEGALFEHAPDNKDLIFYTVFGIEDPPRPEVPHAVQQCQEAGITVRMVTGDNIMTAKKIAADCGIIRADDPHFIAMEGPEFSGLSDTKVDEILPKLRVLARSAPSDKQRLVRRLIENGEVVAVTGDGTNDVPALKEADVGLAMGIRGTDIAKQAADIVILDDNFQSIVTAVKWGRNVFDNIRKFLQFQLTVNVAALAIVVIGALGQRGAPLKAVQLLWVNMIMDTLAALALGTERPTDALLKRKPFGRFDPLLSPTMLRFIICNAIYQLGILLGLLYGAQHVGFLDFKCAYQKHADDVCSSEDIGDHTIGIQTMIFNTFVFCQIFNQINARRVNGERNFYSGIFSNLVYCLIFLVIVIFQVLIIILTSSFFGVTTIPGIGWKQWLTCIVLSIIELPLGYLITFIPVPTQKPKKFQEDVEMQKVKASHINVSIN